MMSSETAAAGRGGAKAGKPRVEEDNMGDGDDPLPQEAPSQPYLPKYLKGPLDASRMDLTEEEKRWAWAVKTAIEDDSELDNLSDMMYAQLALVEHGNVGRALEKACAMQSYRHDYDIRDDFRQGSRMLALFLRRNPGYCLHFFLGANSNTAPESRYTVLMDLTKLDTTCMMDPHELAQMNSGAYYFQHAYSPDLEAVRQGVMFLVECEGYLWKAPKMPTLGVLKRCFEEGMGCYPNHLHRMRFCNSGVLINTLTSMLRSCIPAAIHRKFEVGHQFYSETRLSEVCLVPTPAIAQERVLREMTQSLRRRYQAEAAFELTKPTA